MEKSGERKNETPPIAFGSVKARPISTSRMANSIGISTLLNFSIPAETPRTTTHAVIPMAASCQNTGSPPALKIANVSSKRVCANKRPLNARTA